MSTKDAEVETEEKVPIVIFRTKADPKFQENYNITYQIPIYKHISSINLENNTLSTQTQTRNSAVFLEGKRLRIFQCSANSSPVPSSAFQSKRSSRLMSAKSASTSQITGSVVNLNDRIVGDQPIKRSVEAFQFPVHIGNDLRKRDGEFKKKVNRNAIRDRQLGYLRKGLTRVGTAEARKRLVIKLYNNPTNV